MDGRMTRRLAEEVVGRAAAAVVVAAVLTGCSAWDDGPPEAPERVGLVLGQRSNSAAVTWEQVADEVPDQPVAGSRVVAVGVDGSPSGVPLLDVTLGKWDYSGDAEDELAGVRARLHRAVDELAPAVPEADPLGAISSVARALQGGEGTCRIVVKDSLLGTAGPLAMVDPGVLEAAPEDVTQGLDERGQLPDLSGCDVVVTGAGQVVAPQQELDQAQRRQLWALWETVLRAAGARSVEADDTVLAGAQAEGLPPVTPVVFPPAEPATYRASACTVVLEGATVSFQPDTAVLADPQAASATVGEVAREVADCPGALTVTGTTSSWGTAEGRAAVSLARATAVRDLLAEALGVEPSTITAVGVGTDFAEFVDDRDEQGNLVPQLAARNRTVRISSTDEGAAGSEWPA